MSSLSPLIQDLALILITAAIVTVLFKKIKQPLVLGYIVAGFLISPYFSWMPNIVDTENVQVWSDIGVIFLLFALGLEFSFKKLMRVGGSATITAIVEVVSMLIIGYSCGQFLGWGYMDSLFLGGMLSMSSTTIIIKAFNDLGIKVQKFTGVVFGILVVEDLVAILMMVLLSTLAVSKEIAGIEMGLEMTERVVRLVFFLALWFLLGIFFIPSVLKRIRSMITDEMLLVIASGLCLGMVVIAEKTGFSAALGAFVMGSLLAETVDAERIEHLVKPLKDFFGAVFFVSVGMMVNPELLITYAGPIVVIVLATVIGKAIFSSLGVLLSGQPLRIAIESGFSLAQIGEFAFIIAGLGLSLGVTSDFLYPIVVAVSVITTFMTPYSIKAADPVYNFIDKHLPKKLRNLLDRYGSGSQTADRESEWKKIIKTNALVIIVYSVILVAIIVVFSQYIGPLIAEYAGPYIDERYRGIVISLLTLLPTLFVMAPFLNALMTSKLRTPAFDSLWEDHKFNRGPLVSLIIFRAVLAALFISAVIMQYIHAGLIIIFVIVILLLIFIYSRKNLSTAYSGLESRFLNNFNARENSREVIRKENMAAKLMSKDMHFGNFDVSPDSDIVGKSLKELHFRDDYGVNVVSVIRGVNRINIPNGDEVIYPLDRLIVLGSDAQLRNFKEGIEKENVLSDEENHKEVVLQQFSVSKGSPILGKCIRDAEIRNNDKCLVVGIEQENDPDLILDIDHRFVPGDVIWVVGEKEHIEEMIGRRSQASPS